MKLESLLPHYQQADGTVCKSSYEVQSLLMGRRPCWVDEKHFKPIKINHIKNAHFCELGLQILIIFIILIIVWIN